jgi:hypothetical protein
VPELGEFSPTICYQNICGKNQVVSLAKVMGKEETLKLEELPGTPGDMMGCYADITKIKKNLKQAKLLIVIKTELKFQK